MVRNQRVGMSVAQLVIRLERSNQFHVLLSLHRAQNFHLVADRLAVRFFNRREIRRRALNC